VYGLSEALDGTEGQPLIVVEGPFKVYHLVQMGFSNTVAIFGSSLSDEQAALLVATRRPVILLFDGDDAGRKGEAAAVELLSKKTLVRALTMPVGIEPDQISREQLVFLLA
jgi:DNA primase